jgi:nucleophosmin 3
VNVVQAEAMGYKSDIKFPIAVLKGGSQSQAVLDLLFPDPPVTFKLIQGSGPIHLLGNHSVGGKYLLPMLIITHYLLYV